MTNRLKGLIALLGTTILWGSSFPAIKMVMDLVDEYTYTWLRGLIALLGLTPYVLYKYLSSKRIGMRVIKGGLLAGIAYSLGIWLQGWGTKYTTATNSAFITGLNVVFVHVYVALRQREYNWRLLLSLILALTGLYFLTNPATSFNVGDLLVLLGAFMWAAQIIIVSMYSKEDPLMFTFYEVMPALLFIAPSIITRNSIMPSLPALFLLTYLALVCSNAAFALQVYGQRYISPAVTAIIFLLEPVFATLFAYIVLGELLKGIQVLGAILILISMFISTTAEFKSVRK